MNDHTTRVWVFVVLGLAALVTAIFLRVPLAWGTIISAVIGAFLGTLAAQRLRAWRRLIRVNSRRSVASLREAGYDAEPK